MAKNNTRPPREKLVDISQGTQVKKLYKKKGRWVRVISIILVVLLMIGGAVPIALYFGVGMVNYKTLDNISIDNHAKV